jgi:hypothetical protein
MNCNRWTLGLLSAGLVSLPAVIHAEEKPSSVLTALSATTLSGYVDTSANWNPGTGNANVPGYAWNNPSKSDGFNLNVVELNLEKTVDAADNWGAGYKFSMLAGPDANSFNTSSTGGHSDFAVKQAYVALHAPVGNGLDFKMGVWDTLIGYEVFESINNPNVTRSYGYTMEPTTHTGLQGSYTVNEQISVSAGIANTYGPTINGRPFLGGGTTVPATGQGPRAESFKTYLGSVTYTAPTNWGVIGGSTVTACIIDGFNQFAPGAPVTPAGTSPADETSFYIGATVNTPVTGLKAGVSYDYAATTAENALASNHSKGYANAFGLYASYQISEKWSVYGRGEYGSASSPTAFFTQSSVTTSKSVYEFTGTLQYDLWKNVLSRLEFRWDHAEHGNAYGGTVANGAGVVLPTGNTYLTILADIAYKF